MIEPVTPLLTVDVIIELADRLGRPVVLVERRNEPFGWALPGGFVDRGENLEQAARREAREETGLDVQLKVLLGCYSDPKRDPRGSTASAVYIGEAVGTPVAQDDAKAVALFNPGQWPTLVFDHQLILADYEQFLNTGKVAPLR